ncbi:hypothetical protein [Streptomyces sp. NPDC091217]|uniref:hypothetical protein n=1 Tax=Streptomyces sp. NPDC091217 TaxID=3365975 RepID=UPI00380201A0
MHYTFDQDDLASGEIADSSGNGLTATLVNASTAQAVAGVDGRQGAVPARRGALPRPPSLQALHQRHDHPDALPQGRRSHRRRPRQHHQPPARSTIAGRLYNAKEPMALFELQEWLGHRTPEAAAHYAKITPNTLAKAYNDAGYFASNVRTVEVLVDRDAVASRAAANGDPWQYYDLGHGRCTYTFLE